MSPRRKTATGTEEEPIPPLQDERPRIKELINDRYGVFYGVGLDEDFGRLWLRFRVRDIEREAWERRAFAVQRGAAELLQGRVEFDEIRIETNPARRQRRGGPVHRRDRCRRLGPHRRRLGGLAQAHALFD